MTSINNKNKDGGMIFNLGLHYNDATNAQFNGNIGAITWNSSRLNDIKTFDYTYDGLSRILSANYADGTGTGNYNTTYSYDKNGNILSLSRDGQFPNGAFAEIDNLDYGYLGNRLIKVNDDAEGDAKLQGFTGIISTNVLPGDKSTHEYLYDANGNMTADYNKQINYISYNHLNLPGFIDLGDDKVIGYLYDAAGIKLQQKVFDGADGLSKTTDYVGNFVYENSSLKYILTDGGRLKRSENPGTPGLVPEGDNFKYEYFIKDHLGNTRVVVSENEGVADVLQENHYYPFGLQLSGQSWQNPDQDNVNKIQFQGQELQDELDLGWYHFKWRMHSPEIGRFMVVDPLAEKYYYNSPYAFSENRVIDGVELEGLEVELVNKMEVWPFEPIGWRGLKHVGNAGISGFNGLLSTYNMFALWGKGEIQPWDIDAAVSNGLNDIVYNKDWNSADFLEDAAGGLITGKVLGGSLKLTHKVSLKPSYISKKFSSYTATAATNPQIVSRAARFANGNIGFTKNWMVTGTLKHSAATKFVNKYQGIFGNRGLVTNEYMTGNFGRAFLDIMDETNHLIYDWKFGRPYMNNAQFMKYDSYWQLPINIVDRFGNLTPR